MFGRSSMLVPVVALGGYMLLSFGFLGCTHQQLIGNPALEIFQDMLLPTPDSAPPSYKKGMQLLAAKKYEDALETLQKFLNDFGSTRWSQAAVINSGRALEGLNRWSEALQKYKEAVQSTQTRAPRLQAYALYRASYCYEALGDDQLTIAALLDLLQPNRAKYLNHEMTEAEVPGRLAAAYARVGATREANAFYARAEGAVQKMKASSHGKYPEWLGETLYRMGKVPTELVSWESAAKVLRELEKTQKFALEAAALDQDPWSHEASQSLIGSYRDLFTVLQIPPYPKLDDLVLAKRDAQYSQWNLASEMMDRLIRLKALQLPDSAEDSPEANEIFDFSNDLIHKLQIVMQQQPAGDGLTAASAARIQRSLNISMPQTIESGEVLASEKTGNTADTKKKIPREPKLKMIEPKNPPANKSSPKDDPNL